MKLIHCDGCNEIIPDAMRRMQLTVTVAVGSIEADGYFNADICRTCIEKHKPFGKLWAAVGADEMKLETRR